MGLKKLYISLLVIALIASSATVRYFNTDCDAIALKKELDALLKPDYKYDSSKTTRFIYKKSQQTTEIEIPVLSGESYRFLFNVAGVPKDVDINIYNKRSTNKGRKLLYALKDNRKPGEHIYTFEPEKVKSIYINYVIPPTNEVNLQGCIVFLLGYK